jgi:hypothetical protein
MCEEFDMPDLPIVCTLTPDALRARQEGLLTELLRRSTSRANSGQVGRSRK